MPDELEPTPPPPPTEAEIAGLRARAAVTGIVAAAAVTELGSGVQTAIAALSTGEPLTREQFRDVQALLTPAERDAARQFWQGGMEFLAGKSTQIPGGDDLLAFGIRFAVDRLRRDARDAHHAGSQAERLVIALYQGAWSDVGLPSELIDRDPTPELRAALLGLFEDYITAVRG